MKPNILEEVVKYNQYIQKKIDFINYGKSLINKLTTFFSGEIVSISNEICAEISNACYLCKSSNMYINDEYLLTSFQYYVDELSKILLDNYVSIDKIKTYSSYVNKSWHNVVYSMYEEIMRRKYAFKKWDLVLFEASPKDQIQCSFVDEIDEIRELASQEESRYHPVVRFATNGKVIKSTIDNHDIKCYHFACHGANGILYLEEQSMSFKLKSFQFLTKFVKRSDEIYLVYLNSCESESFAKKVKEHSFGKTRFSNTIGFDSSINDSHAKEFAITFYEHFVKREDHNVSDSLSFAHDLYNINFPDSELLKHLKHYHLD